MPHVLHLSYCLYNPLCLVLSNLCEAFPGFRLWMFD